MINLNKTIQFLAAGKGVRQWEIAEEIGIAEETLSRWMRKTLSEDKKTLILAAIEKLSQGEK